MLVQGATPNQPETEQIDNNLKVKNNEIIMANLKFKRTKENFICASCGAKIIGTGYTDHCPNCLYSKHVDVFPGDRQAKCGGLMQPISATIKGQSYVIFYQCQKCGYQSSVKAGKDDNLETIIALINKPF